MTELAVGQTKDLTATHEPAEAHIASYAWHSSDEAVVTVAGDGETASVTAVAPGTARITLDTTNANGTPGPSHSEDVTVTEAAPPAAPEEPAAPTADVVGFTWSDPAAEPAPEAPPEETPPTSLGGVGEPAAWNAAPEAAPAEETSHGA